MRHQSRYVTAAIAAVVGIMLCADAGDRTDADCGNDVKLAAAAHP